MVFYFGVDRTVPSFRSGWFGTDGVERAPGSGGSRRIRSAHPCDGRTIMIRIMIRNITKIITIGIYTVKQFWQNHYQHPLEILEEMESIQGSYGIVTASTSSINLGSPSRVHDNTEYSRLYYYVVVLCHKVLQKEKMISNGQIQTVESTERHPSPSKVSCGLGLIIIQAPGGDGGPLLICSCTRQLKVRQ